MALLQSGLSNLDIANALGISHDTARRHSSRVLQKLQLGSTASLPCIHLSLNSDALRAMPPIAGVLTATEIDVLALICQGNSSKSIARLLQVSPRTVDKHRQHLGTKLGTRTSRAMTAWVARQYVLCGIAAPIASE